MVVVVFVNGYWFLHCLPRTPRALALCSVPLPRDVTLLGVGSAGAPILQTTNLSWERLICPRWPQNKMADGMSAWVCQTPKPVTRQCCVLEQDGDRQGAWPPLMHVHHSHGSWATWRTPVFVHKSPGGSYSLHPKPAFTPSLLCDCDTPCLLFSSVEFRR